MLYLDFFTHIDTLDFDYLCDFSIFYPNKSQLFDEF